MCHREASAETEDSGEEVTDSANVNLWSLQLVSVTMVRDLTSLSFDEVSFAGARNMD